MPSEKDPQEEKVKIHQPEYVILNGDEEEGQRGPQPSAQADYVELIQKLGRKSYSWQARILIVMAALFVGIALLFVLLLTLLSTAFAALTLFLNQELKQSMFKCWRNLRKIAVIFLGLLLGIFSPALGFGLIILYFLLHGESLRSSFFSRIIR